MFRDDIHIYIYVYIYIYIYVIVVFLTTYPLISLYTHNGDGTLKSGTMR